MLTDSEKLDKILDNQKIILEGITANRAMLNLFIDMLSGFMADRRKISFEESRKITLDRVEAFKEVLRNKSGGESAADAPED